jgi:POT family proton-dependent oligopeptide transporter
VQNQRSGFANPGALGLGQQTATNLTNVFMLLQFIAPLPWALLADMRLGRLKTLMISMWYVPLLPPSCRCSSHLGVWLAASS